MSGWREKRRKKADHDPAVAWAAKMWTVKTWTVKMWAARRRTGKAGAVIVMLLVSLLAAGCSGKETVVLDDAQQEEPGIHIGLSFESFVIERWMRERDVFVSTAKELGAEVNVQSANGDVQEQISQIEYFIKKQVDVIVVVAGDCEALTDVMVKAREAGIKTVSYDRLIQNAGCDLYISFDSVQVGRLMAGKMKENIPEGGKLFLIQGPLTDHNVSLIREGVDEVLAGSNLEVVYESNCVGWLAERAYTDTKEGLKLAGNVEGIICGNDDLASQAFRALSEERLAGTVCLVGQDGDLAACQRIVEGTQEMTAFKSVEQEAGMAARCAVMLGRGENIEETIGETMSTAYDGTYNVPYLELQPIAVTKENMDEVIIKGGFHAREDVYLNVNSGVTGVK